MSDQQRFTLDGQPVSFCQGGFTAAFDMTTADAESVSYDDTVVLVVVARMGLPSFTETKSGDIIRKNKFEVSAARVADPKLGNELAEMFDLEIQQKLPFTPAAAAAAASAALPPPPPGVAGSTAGVVPSGPPVGVPVGAPVGAPVGTHAHDDALRSFLDAP